MTEDTNTNPSFIISFIPLLTLIFMVSVSISIFGSDALSGANQISLLTATGMLQTITSRIVTFVRGRVSLVTSTAFTGLALNTMTSDQYMSIVLTANMYGKVYDKMGLERRLLSRTTEDSTTVTSVLIPWNTCGMTQSTVLGVATIDYLPYAYSII